MDLETYAIVKKGILHHLGINLDAYKDEQMRRRLDAWLVRTGNTSWTDYFGKLKANPEEAGRLRNYLTINVTEFFRDQERWQMMRTKVLPDLLKESLGLRELGGGLKVWSAGCSVGAEPYSLAILMDEIAPSRKHYLLATDLDRGALARAKAGGPYIEDEIKNVSSAQKSAYFNHEGPTYFIKDALKNKITFREQNMLADTFETGFDLIVCRNVVIYFTNESKDLLFRKFCGALRKGGILFVGGTEIIPRPQEIGFASSGISLYKKV